ncbi:MAG: class I SAM-dependent rRNA methyltransferase [Candidatus Magasanikiibacteriota bacterium]
MITLVVFSKRVGPIRGRHPWVFSGALKNIPDGLASGTPVKLVDENNHFLAQGYFNSYSQIAVRLWSWVEDEDINEDFFIRRIELANDLRVNYIASKKTDSYRLINSENDLLPGLIVDKYADYLSVQFHTIGMEQWKDQIVSALVKILKPKGIYERSDAKKLSREKDSGIVVPKTEENNLLYGKMPDKIIILENGLKFYVDIKGGQKTGFFLDQREKRQALMKYVKDKNVLNCFSYTGGFSVYALAGGANKVVSVDVSEPALELARQNVELNGFDLKKCEFIAEDVKRYLQDLGDTKYERYENTKDNETKIKQKFNKNLKEIEKIDVIILDPPAFVKDRKKIREGLLGYRRINEQALQILPPDGILVSASCSAHVSLDDFRFMLSESAGHTGRTLQILETYIHGIDHPELVAFMEGEYLKCVFGRVI